VRKRIEADPEKRSYTDQALAAVRDSDVDELELFTQTDAARHAVVHAREIDRITHPRIQKLPAAGA
jgi:hypothetical protein